MSETNITVTPGSGGPNIDLEQVDNGNSRQVMVIGDPAIAARVANVSPTGALQVDLTGVGANALGQELSAASLPVVIASDQSAVPASVSNFPAWWTPANRTRVVLSADAIASVAAEAMMTFQSYKAGVVAAGITSYTVTAGKTLRLIALEIKIRPATPSTTVTFANTVLRLREGALITSPLIASFPVLMQTNADSNPTTMGLPDGLEFPAGTVLGMSHLASAATILESFVLIGFEY